MVADATGILIFSCSVPRLRPLPIGTRRAIIETVAAKLHSYIALSESVRQGFICFQTLNIRYIFRDRLTVFYRCRISRRNRLNPACAGRLSI